MGYTRADKQTRTKMFPTFRGSAHLTRGKVEPFTLIRCTCVGPTFLEHEPACMASVAFRLSGWELVGYVNHGWYGYPLADEVREEAK